MESWFHTLKTEWVNHQDYRTRRQAKSDIFEYIEAFYNRNRRHSGPGLHDPGTIRDDQYGCLTTCPQNRGKISHLRRCAIHMEGGKENQSGLPLLPLTPLVFTDANPVDFDGGWLTGTGST